MYTALQWIEAIIEVGGDEVIPYSADILGVVLPHITDHTDKVSSVASSLNQQLLYLIKNAPESAKPPAEGFIRACLKTLGSGVITSRLASLTWLTLIHSRFPDQLYPLLDDLYAILLRTLSDPSDDIMHLDLEVIEQLSHNERFFAKQMESLVRLFKTDSRFLHEPGSKIIKLLCGFTDCERIFTSLAEILVQEKNTTFVAETVQKLNILLLSMDEAKLLRVALRSRSSVPLFETLYRAWSFSPSSLFSLCLLCQMYTHASELVQKL